jgi:hypothetical protein
VRFTKSSSFETVIDGETVQFTSCFDDLSCFVQQSKSCEFATGMFSVVGSDDSVSRQYDVIYFMQKSKQGGCTVTFSIGQYMNNLVNMESLTQEQILKLEQEQQKIKEDVTRFRQVCTFNSSSLAYSYTQSIQKSQGLVRDSACSGQLFTVLPI